jgi:hypothetical protein
MFDLNLAFTQIRLVNVDKALRDVLDQHAGLFSLGENIGTLRPRVPTGGYTWHPTRQPYQGASAHASEVDEECSAAERVLVRLLGTVGRLERAQTFGEDRA